MPTFNPNDPYRPLFGSLADRKSVALAEKYKQKKEHLDPTPAPAPEESVGVAGRLGSEGSTGQSNLLNVGLASMAQAGGNLADIARYTSNKVLGTKLDDSEATGWSNPKTADAVSGVSREYRDEGQALQQQVMQDVVNAGEMKGMDAVKGYGLAALSAIKAAPFTAMDSAATLPEIAAGSLLTGLTGGVAAPLVLGKKLKTAGKTAEKVKKAYDKAKELKEANRLGKLLKSANNLPAATAKSAGQASILTADMLQQQRNQYKAANNQKEPSAERMATMGLGILATTIWEPAIIANLFIPNFKKEIGAEITGLAKNLGKGSNLANIGKRIGSSLEKLAKAGTAEAFQEYAQTWQESLSAQITPEQADDLWTAVRSKLSDKTLQDQALTGGLLGAAAGGITRGAISAPADVAGSAVDLTKATAKGTANVVKGTAEFAGKQAQKQAVRAASKVMNPEEQATLRGHYETRKAAVDKTVADMERRATSVEEHKTFQDIMSNKELTKEAQKAQRDLGYTEEDLQNPKKLKRLKDKMVRNNRASQDVIKAKLAGSTVGQVAVKLGEGVKNVAVKTAEDVVSNEQVKEAIRLTKKATNVSKKAIKDSVIAIKEVRSSSALGLIEMGMKEGDAAFDTIKKNAKNLNLSDLQKASVALAPHSPKAAKYLRRMAATKKVYMKKYEQRHDDLITKENLSPAITDTAKKDVIPDSEAVGVASELRYVLNGTIDDGQTLNKVIDALDTYENSPAYQQQQPGAISNNDMAVYRDRIVNAKSRLKPNIDKVKEAVDAAAETIGKGSKKVRKATWKTYVKAQRKLRDVKENETVQETVDRVQKAIEGLDEKAEDFADQLDAKLAKMNTKPEPKREAPKPDDQLKNALGVTVAAIVQGGEQLADITNKIPTIAKKLKAKGYETAEDLDNLVKEYPELGQDSNFYGKLKSHFKSEATPEPESNVVMHKDDKINAEEDLPVEDNYLVSTFKTMLGCSK